jgi:hypothetical protein
MSHSVVVGIRVLVVRLLIVHRQFEARKSANTHLSQSRHFRLATQNPPVFAYFHSGFFALPNPLRFRNSESTLPFWMAWRLRGRFPILLGFFEDLLFAKPEGWRPAVVEYRDGPTSFLLH